MQHKWMSRIGIGAVVLGLSGALAGSVSAQPAPPPMQAERVLTVTGLGFESVPYSEAVFNLGVQAEAKTAIDAQKQMRERLNTLVAQLKQLQVQKLQTTNVQIYPRYNNPKPGQDQQISGFISSSALRFRVPIAQAGVVLDAAVQSGANSVQGLSFDITDAESDKARETALARAVNDAQAQAQVVLKTLGLTAKEVRTIQIGSALRPGPIPLAAEARSFAKADLGPTAIEGGESRVEASVTLQISY